MAYAEEAAKRFFEWARYADTPDEPEGPFLQDFLYSWLVDGHGVDSVGGKYEHWLTTVIYIADAVFKDPSLLEYVGDEMEFPEAEQYHDEHGEWPSSTIRQRPIQGILDPDNNVFSVALDRHHFDMLVWRRDHTIEPTPNAE
jgi:hypothetical protein